MTIPFRWNLKRPEQLGTWLDHLPRRPALNEADLADLRAGTADILASTAGASLGFIGRTPENIFDYLSGIFEGVPDAPGLHLIQFSMRWPGPGGVKAIPTHAFAGLSAYFRHEGVHPAQIATGPAPLALVDFVASGGTMETLCAVLQRMAHDAGVDWNSVQRRLMLIGLLPEKKTSPNTWRWQQHQDWLVDLPDTVIRNVSLPAGFIYDIANIQEKTTPSFTLRRWAGEPSGRERPSENQLLALWHAVQLYERGTTKTEREALARDISQHEKMKLAPVRQLVARLRRS